MFKLRTLIYSLFMMFIVAGCVPPQGIILAPGANGTMVNGSYQQGENDGCWSKQHAGTKKDTYLYNHSGNYRDGWTLWI